MATTITCGVMRSGSRGVRASINNHVFIECGVMRSGSTAPDAKIRSGLGAGAIIVDSWSPENNSDDVDHMHSFKVNCHASANITEKEVVYDGGGSFETGGTLTNLTEIGEGVQLAVSAPDIDFEDYLLGTWLTSASQPDNWTHLGNAYFGWMPNDEAESWDGRHIECTSGNNIDHTRLDTAGEMAAGVVAADFFFDSDGSAGLYGLSCNLTGSGTALRGHTILCGPGSSYMSLKRINSASSWFGIASTSISTPSYDTAYRMKFKFTTNGTTTWFYFKWWALSGSEPVDFTYVGQDTTYVSAGYVGLVANSGVSGAHTRVDNFSVEPDPATYFTEGDWTSNEIDMTSIVNYSYALLEWDETTPASTTATIKARWDTGGTWLVCTNGGQIPGIDLGELMESGASKDSLELKIELATTDSGSTPLVENLRFYHEPLASESLMIDIHGTIECVEADGTLDVWGVQQVSGGSAIEAWDDVWCETIQDHHLFGLDFSLLVKLVYNGVEIDEIIVSSARDFWSESSPKTGYQWSMLPLTIESPVVEARWVCLKRWAPMGHNYGWVLADLTLGIHADAWYYVGRPTRNDHPAFVIGAIAQRDDHPASLLAKGYARNSHPGELLVQGDRLNDVHGMVMPAVRSVIDHAGMALPAVRELADHPGMHVVYGVNRDGAIFVNVVDDVTYAKLVAEGIIFS